MKNSGMTFWDLVDKRMPTERQWVTIATFSLAGFMLQMATDNAQLWDIELFKTLLTLIIGTALVNMIIGFHFTANKSDDTRAENTGKAFDALKQVAENNQNTSEPQIVVVDQPANKPIPVNDKAAENDRSAG